MKVLLPLLLFIIGSSAVYLYTEQISGYGGVTLPVRHSMSKEIRTPQCTLSGVATIQQQKLIISLSEEVLAPTVLESIGSSFHNPYLAAGTRTHTTYFKEHPTHTPDTITLVQESCTWELPVVPAETIIPNLIQHVHELSSPATYAQVLESLGNPFEDITRKYPNSAPDTCAEKPVQLRNPEQRSVEINQRSIYKPYSAYTQFPLSITENNGPIEVVFCDGSQVVFEPGSHAVIYGNNTKDRVYLRSGRMIYQTVPTSITPKRLISTPDVYIAHTEGVLVLSYTGNKTEIEQREGTSEYQFKHTNGYRQQFGAHQTTIPAWERIHKVLQRKQALPTVLTYKNPTTPLTIEEVAQLLYSVFEQKESPHPSYALLYAQHKQLIAKTAAAHEIFTHYDLSILTQQLENLTITNNKL